jgi:hypothetical protein
MHLITVSSLCSTSFSFFFLFSLGSRNNDLTYNLFIWFLRRSAQEVFPEQKDKKSGILIGFTFKVGLFFS